MTTLVNHPNTFEGSSHDKQNHGKQSTAVVLVNLGTPEAPKPREVRKFLAEFLADQRVVELPKLLWWPILHGIILRTRPRKSAHAYEQVWTAQGSPLMVHSQALADSLRVRLRHRLGDDCKVALAMTYGQPSIRNVLFDLKQQGIERLLVLPLYPQYSGTTTAAVFDRVINELKTWRALPSLHFVRDYYHDAGFIQALAESVREHWQQHERAHLFMSFHGVPQACVDKGDPYQMQCQVTAKLLAGELGLSPSEWSLGFQSRFGRQQWIKPYTETLLSDYAQNGPKRLTVVCPCFAADCLETLEEIAIRNKEAFLAEGGESFRYVPALNARDSHADALCGVILRQLGSHV